MLARVVLALALRALAARVPAQAPDPSAPYASPGWPQPEAAAPSRDAPAPPPAAPTEPYASPGWPAAAFQDPALAVSTAGWEWGVGLLTGRRSGWWAPSARRLGLMLEAALLRQLGDRLVVGAMLSTGLAVHALAGPRFRLSPGLRLDLLADVGVTRQELGGDERFGGTDTWLAPTVGARAGISWARPEGGRYLTVGAAVRHAFPHGTITLCDADSTCDRTVDLGGYTIVGAFLTYGGARPRSR